MNYDLSGAVKAKSAGKFLSAGIKDATFKGVEYNLQSSKKTGETYKVLSLTLDVDGYGEFVHNFFEPTSSDRAETSWGVAASSVDHFLIAVRQIIEAVNPQAIKDIDEGKIKLSGTFKQMVDQVAKLTEDYVGARVQIKLIPNNTGFNDFPAFPARIRNGELGIATWIIGHDLTLTPAELKRIESAKNAAPTNMADKSSTSDLVSSMSSDLDDDDDSDLPF